MDFASNKSLFDLLTENMMDYNYVARMLHIYKDITVEQYMFRYQKGGMTNRLFKKIYNLCEDYVNSVTSENMGSETVFEEAA